MWGQYQLPKLIVFVEGWKSHRQMSDSITFCKKLPGRKWSLAWFHFSLSPQVNLKSFQPPYTNFNFTWSKSSVNLKCTDSKVEGPHLFTKAGQHRHEGRYLLYRTRAKQKKIKEKKVWKYQLANCSYTLLTSKHAKGLFLDPWSVCQDH